MQAKRKLTALLLSLCMLLGMLPMTAFAAGVPAAPTNLKLELTETGLKASWDKPETTGELDIFEYEVTLYRAAQAAHRAEDCVLCYAGTGADH